MKILVVLNSFFDWMKKRKKKRVYDADSLISRALSSKQIEDLLIV